MSDYVKLKNLVDPPQREVDSTLKKLAADLGRSGERCRIQFRFLTEDGEIQRWLELGAKTQIAEGMRKREDVQIEVALKLQTWFEVAEGKLSPVEAWYGGRMGFRGDLDLARRLVKAAAASGDKLCPFEPT